MTRTQNWAFIRKKLDLTSKHADPNISGGVQDERRGGQGELPPTPNGGAQEPHAPSKSWKPPRNPWLLMVCQGLSQWIGLRENFNRKP